MRYAKLFQKLFCQPVLLETGTRYALEKTLLSALRGEIVDVNPELKKMSDDSRNARSNRLLEPRGATAVIHVDGVLDRNLSLFEQACFGATDTADLQLAIGQVAADRDVKNVLFAFDSPGGSIGGIPETAAAIAKLGQRKNTAALVNGGQCCSAAMWIASACDQILCTESSQLASVGVYLALLDESQALADQGIKIETIQSGALKTAGAPWKPMTDEERAFLQARTDELGATFRAAVKSSRPKVEPEDMQGQSFFGRDAVAKGFADALVSDLEEALKQF